MNNAKVAVSLLALSLTFAVVGCAADEGTPEEKGESTSNLSCDVVPTQVVIGGKTVNTKKVVCDGAGSSKGTKGTSTTTTSTTTNDGSTCTLNGREMICEGGGCRAVNGQPAEGCRWADGADAPAPKGTDAPDQNPNADLPDQDPSGADFPDFDPAGGTSSCTINGRKAVCDDGGCTAVNGQPGPGCRFIE